ncbi:MAG: hypothetical protein ACI81P_002206, partial [Neolewinella sp.]
GWQVSSSYASNAQAYTRTIVVRTIVNVGGGQHGETVARTSRSKADVQAIFTDSYRSCPVDYYEEEVVDARVTTLVGSGVAQQVTAVVVELRQLHHRYKIAIHPPPLQGQNGTIDHL